MTELRVENIRVEAGGATLLKGASVKFGTGECVALVGPNGAGKTTLLKCALGLIKPASGAVLVDGAPLAALSPIERARRIAYLPQMRPLAWPVRVRDMVALGRFAYGASLSNLKGVDAEAVARALAACGLDAFADRRTDELSGGELARAHAARALASEAPLLLADEPTASLDPAHQFKIMNGIHDHVRKGGGALIVLHDIALAARYADRLVWMKDGEIVADGRPAETLTAERMRDVFGVDATVAADGASTGLTLTALA